ncbi:MAG TPA: energy transducer TonB [Gemmatimonadales bacterium]
MPPVPSVPMARPARPLSLLLPPPRRSGWPGVASVLLHFVLVGLLVFAQWRGLAAWQEAAREGPDPARRGGGGGGGSIHVVTMPAYRAPQAARSEPPVPPPAPVPVTPPAEVVPPVAPEPVVTAPVVDSSSAASPGRGGTGSGGGAGSGTGTGQGSGTGPGSGSGSGGGVGTGSGRAVPPEPRQLILPPLDYPKAMRGRTVAVTFWVNVEGRVERVVLDQPLDDRGFQKKFVETMRNYRFRPARGPDGQAVPGTTTVTVTF